MQELFYYLGEDLLSILGRHSDQVCKVSNLVFMVLYSVLYRYGTVKHTKFMVESCTNNYWD